MMRLALCLTAMTALLSISSLATAADQALKTEPYAWDNVVMKGTGFIDGIVFGRSAPNHLYMHTDMGGAYRYDYAKQRWVCLTDWIQWDDGSLRHGGVETAAVDPSDAKRVYFGVGTYMGKSAILYSDDGTQTLKRTDVPFPMNGNGNGRNAGQRMQVDPSQGNILLYGTRNMGLWKSNDYAASWLRIDSFTAVGDERGPAGSVGINFVLFDKASAAENQPTPVIYVGVATIEANKVFRSTDAGASWSLLPGQPGGRLLPTRAAVTPDGKTLYITYGNADTGAGPNGISGGNVYRIDDPASAAPKWTDISPSPIPSGYSGVCLSAKDPNLILVTTIDRWNPGDDMFRSIDGGKTWTALDINKHRDDSSAPWAASCGMHWTGDVQIDPFNPEVALFTTGFGLYRTTNLSAEFPTWVFFNEGFEQAAVLELVSPPTGPVHLVSAIGDRDGFRHEDLTVSPAAGQFGLSQKRHMGTNQNISMAFLAPETLVRTGNRAQYSFDGGITWEIFSNPPAAAPATTRAATGPTTRRGRGALDVAVTADGKGVVLSNSDGTFYATRQDSGWSEWTRSAEGPGRAATLFADLVNPRRMYAMRDRSFYLSDDGGQAWQLQTDKLAALDRRIRPAIGHEGHLFAAARENGLLRSTDAGKTWTRVNESAVIVANQVGIGCPMPGAAYPAVYIGGRVLGQNGFFRSDDAGETWTRINDDQHHYGWVTVIQGDSQIPGRLYVGANGRGVLYGTPANR